MGPNQTYSLLHSKVNHKKKKMKKSWEWERIVVNDATDKGLISKIYEHTYTTQQQQQQ